MFGRYILEEHLNNMKRIGNLYKNICDIDNIKLAIKNSQKGKKKKPKYETRLVDKKSVTVFEMTHNQAGKNGSGYDKYPLITHFEAENQDALKEYIDAYLDSLINAINEPVCECDKCNGNGVIFNIIEKI